MSNQFNATCRKGIKKQVALGMSTKSKLEALFQLPNRFSNFGPCINSICIRGIRGIGNLTVTLQSPITAFSGPNGSGKSTIIQLLSCAYKKLSGTPNSRRYWVNEFFPVSTLDPNVLAPTAEIVFEYSTHSDQPQRCVVRRKKSKWTGYQSQPEKFISYIGFLLYIPNIETKHFVVTNSKNLQVGTKRMPSREALDWTSKILGTNYDDVNFAQVTHKKMKDEVGILGRNGQQYSESHMGFGEGRVMYLVDLMEKSPAKSFFALEEPETSLHPAAQTRLAEYLLDVVIRKRHQIVLSTHSDRLLSLLPSESRKLLQRDSTGIQVTDCSSVQEITNLLTGHEEPACFVIVEDRTAEILLTEIIRLEDPQTLKKIKIVQGGSYRDVAKTVEVLRNEKRRAIAFRDGDVGEDPSKYLFSLPGGKAPEKTFFSSPVVKMSLKNEFNFDIDEYLRLSSEKDHHKELEKIAHTVHVPPDSLLREFSKQFAGALEPTVRESILKKINDQICA